MIFGSYKLKHSKAQANYLSIRKVIGHCKFRCTSSIRQHREWSDFERSIKSPWKIKELVE